MTTTHDMEALLQTPSPNAYMENTYYNNNIIYAWLVFIITHIHSGISQTLFFLHHHIFELSLGLHLKQYCLWPSLMYFAELTLLNLPEHDESVLILNHPMDTPPSVEHMVFRYIPQLSRKVVWVLNVFISQLYKMTS